MAKLNYGYPDRVYFEIFDGQHPAEKIYSVQVADWDSFVQSEAPVAAVVQSDFNQAISQTADHLKVNPTMELSEFMQDRNIDLPGEIYIKSEAFTWQDNGEQEQSSKGGKAKVILAAIVAAVALLK